MNPIRETHAGGVLRVSAPPGAWGSVPLALIEDVRLDLAARAVAIWLATRPAGWQISVAHLLSALHLGRDRWRRIAGELQSAGYLARSPTPSGPGGRWVWEIVFCAIPTTAGGEFPASAPAQLQKKTARGAQRLARAGSDRDRCAHRDPTCSPQRARRRRPGGDPEVPSPGNRPGGRSGGCRRRSRQGLSVASAPGAEAGRCCAKLGQKPPRLDGAPPDSRRRWR
ncbi:hypothetical protein THICB2_780011 [Thiomonas sp. CB2]|nr:hypothetical protein THICB2_780011 [Thiomonas sp. CB2]